MYPFKIFVQVTVYTQKWLLFKRKIIVILIIPFNIIDNTYKKTTFKTYFVNLQQTEQFNT